MSRDRFDKPDGARKGCVVLIVDDEKEYARALGERLSERGFSVITATSGEEALKTLGSQKTGSGAAARFNPEDVEV
jgi:CheY-like chemotaxis protein